MLSLLGRSCCRTRSCPTSFPVPSANAHAESSSKNDPSKAGWDRPRFKSRFVTARLVSGIFFPQRESLRLDSQNLTPRARRKVVYAGGNEKSHRVGSKSLAELGEWKLNPTRVSELTLQAGREMKEQQTAAGGGFPSARGKSPAHRVPRGFSRGSCQRSASRCRRDGRRTDSHSRRKRSTRRNASTLA